MKEMKNMKLTSALIGLAALGGVAFSSGAQASTVAVPPGYVCNEWGHCWPRHTDGYGYGYYHPHYWGGWGWHRHYSYGGWHRWHNWNSGA